MLGLYRPGAAQGQALAAQWPRVLAQCLSFRGYKSKARHKLAANVTKAGKGKTIFASKASRQSASAARKQNARQNVTRSPVQPTTLDMGKFATLSGVPSADRKTHRNLLDKVNGFDQLRINADVRQSLLSNVLSETSIPTPVQKVAIKALRTQRKDPNAFKSWLLAAETGSGKTLSYLIPILSELQESNPESTGPAVRSMVLVPTLELVSQVAETASKLAPQCSILGVSAEMRASQLAKRIIRGVDVLITTPDKVRQFSERDETLATRSLAECRTVVVDEADSLMNESFHEATLAVVNLCQQVSDLVFVTATIPRHFDKVLRDSFPETTRLVTPSIHRLPRHIDFRVIEVFRPPYRDNKQLALQQALYSIYNDNSEPDLQKRVLVFVNKKASVQPLVAMLNKSGYPTIGLDGTLTAEERSSRLEAFISPAKKREGDSDKLHVMVATDLVARGIDMHRIKNVILYDLPWSAADLLHRAGRTGRLNAKGRVLLLVSRKESQGWVRGLETIVKRGQALA